MKRSSSPPFSLPAIAPSHALPLLVAVLLLAACGDASAGDKGEVFTIVLPVKALRAGQKADAPVRIETVPNFKWNVKYPYRFEITAEGPIKVTPGRIAKSGGGAKVRRAGKNAVLPLRIEGSAAGTGRITIKGSFSICSDESCKVFRGREYTFSVRVK